MKTILKRVLMISLLIPILFAIPSCNKEDLSFGKGSGTGDGSGDGINTLIYQSREINHTNENRNKHYFR